MPVLSCARSCCGREKSANTGDSDCSETIGFARVQLFAEVDQPDAQLPGERRADGFLFNRGADGVGIGLVLLQASPPAVSSSDWETVLSARSLRVALGVEPRQFHLRFERPAVAPPPTTCPAAPADRPWPPPRRIQRRFRSPCPAISGVTVTPCTAVMEPMAVSVSCQFSSRATADGNGFRRRGKRLCRRR